MALIIEELDSGNVLITSNSGTEVYVPTFQFKDAKVQFDEFSELYHKEFYDIALGVDWYPTIQYFLFHKLFWPYVLYKAVLDRALQERHVEFSKKGSQRIRTLYDLFKPQGLVKRITRRFINYFERLLVRIHNDYVFQAEETLVFLYSEKDFRVNSLCEYSKSGKHAKVLGDGLKFIIRSFWRKDIFLLVPSRYYFSRVRGPEELEKVAIRLARGLAYENKKQFNIYLNSLSKCFKTRRLLGIDDPLFLFPFLLAANRSDILTVGFQHGLYGREHVGYSVGHAESFEWYRWLVVWDDLYKGIYLDGNRFFSQDRVVSGVYADYFNFELKPNPRNNKVLVIWDRFCEMDVFNRWLRVLFDKNYQLIIKTRPGITKKAMLKELPFSRDEMEAVTLVGEINQPLLDDISLIVGVKSALLYGLLCSIDRPLWILKTKYHYLHEVMSHEAVMVMSENDMENIDALYNKSVKEGNKYRSSSDFDDVSKVLEFIEKASNNSSS